MGYGSGSQANVPHRLENLSDPKTNLIVRIDICVPWLCSEHLSGSRVFPAALVCLRPVSVCSSPFSSLPIGGLRCCPVCLGSLYLALPCRGRTLREAAMSQQGLV